MPNGHGDMPGSQGGSWDARAHDEIQRIKRSMFTEQEIREIVRDEVRAMVRENLRDGSIPKKGHVP